jgi:hypothetical protein
MFGLRFLRRLVMMAGLFDSLFYFLSDYLWRSIKCLLFQSGRDLDGLFGMMVMTVHLLYMVVVIVVFRR